MDIRPYDPKTVAQVMNSYLTMVAKENGQVILSVPGGRSPGPVLTNLSRLMDSETRDATALTWLDERWVPAGHEDRNDQQTLKAWQRGGELPGIVLPMPSSNLFPEVDDAAVWYSEFLNELMGPEAFLDVVLIGIGEDGHFASLFPDHRGLNEEGSVFVCLDSPKPPATRLSLGLSLIKSAGLKIVLVLGEEKGKILKEGYQNPGPHVPISLLIEDPSIVWYLDDEAQKGFEAL